MSNIVFIIGFNYDSNCYLIDDNILVDTGAGQNKDYLFSKLRENEVNPEDIELIVNTHCHFDHIGGNQMQKLRFINWMRSLLKMKIL